ncbi:MAG: hypothetical protein ABW318_08105, partial [Vicinamibacterales bacterium]
TPFSLLKGTQGIIMFTNAAHVVVFVFLCAFSTTFAETVEWRNDDAQDVTRAVLATPQGIYAVGQADCGNGGNRCKGALTRFSPDGAIEWQVVDEPGRSTVFEAIAADDDAIYVHGQVNVEPGDGNAQRPWDSSFVRKYTHDGTELWEYVDFFDGPDGFRAANMYPTAIGVDGVGVYTLSARYRFAGVEALVRRFDFDGNLVWLRVATEPSPFRNPENPAALAIGEGSVFAAAVGPPMDVTGVIYRYSIDGDLLDRIGVPRVTDNGLAYRGGRLFFCSRPHEGNIQVLALIAVDTAGTVRWSQDFAREMRSSNCVVTASEDGIAVALNLTPRNGIDWRAGPTVRFYDRDGNVTDRLEFPSLVAEPNSVSVLDGQVYVAGSDNAGTGFTARLSGEELLPPTIALQNPAGDARLALLDHHYGAGPVAASSQAADGSGPASFAFSDDLRPVAWFAIEDLNSDGRDDLVVVSREPASVEVADGANGAPLLTIPLNANFRPVAAAASARAGSPVIAVLMRHPVKGDVRVDEFDALTGMRLASVPYNPNYRPVALVPQGEQFGERYYAVLGADDDPGAPHKIEIRHTALAYIKNIWLDNRFAVLDAVGFDDGTGASRIAVLRRNADEGWVDIAIVDPAAGEVVRTLAFDGNIVLGDFVPTADIDMNLAPQFSIAGTGAADGKHRVQTRDLASGGVLHNAWVSRETPIQDLVYLPAGAGVPTPSLGLVVRDNASDSRFRVYFVDLLTGTKSGPLEYAF